MADSTSVIGQVYSGPSIFDNIIGGGLNAAQPGYTPTAAAPAAPVAPGVNTGLPAANYGLPQTNVGGIDYANIALQSQIAAAQQKYLMLRLQMLEIPQYLAQTDVDRHNLALQALNIYATQTGWIDTAALQEFNTWANSDLNYAAPPGLYNGSTTGGTGTYNTINGTRTVDQMRDELINAGANPDEINNWTDQQIADNYGQTTGGAVTAIGTTETGSADTATYNTINGPRTIQQMQQELYTASGGMPDKLTASTAATMADYGAVTGGPVSITSTSTMTTATPSAAAATGSYGYAAGQQPTIAGAAQLTSPLGLAQNVSLLGLDSSSSLPAQTQQPTLQAQQIFANPSALPQSLVMSGLTTQAAADLIASSPMYKNLMTTAGVQPNVSSPLQPYNTGAAPSGFNFVQGNQLPGAQTLDWLATGDPRASVVTGLAAFSGQDPESFWKKFQSSVPTATASPLSKYL